MIERLLKWFGFSVGFMILPIILSIIMHKIVKMPVDLNSYSGELLFMAVTLSATSIGDVLSLSKKGAKGVQTTFLLIVLIFIALVCITVYVIVDVVKLFGIAINNDLITVLMAIGVISSTIIGVLCQVFLQKIEGD